MGRASLKESYDRFRQVFDIYKLIASEEYYNNYYKSIGGSSQESHLEAVKKQIEEHTHRKIPKKHIKMIEKEIEEKHKILRDPPDWIKNLIYDYLIRSRECSGCTFVVPDELQQKIIDTLIPFKFVDESIKEEEEEKLISMISAYRVKPTENGISLYDMTIEMPTREKIKLIYSLLPSGDAVDIVSEIVKNDFKDAEDINTAGMFSLKEDIDEDVKKAFESYGLYVDGGEDDKEKGNIKVKGFLMKRARNIRFVTTHASPNHIYFTFDIPEEIKDAEGIKKYIVDYINSNKDYILALSEIIDAIPPTMPSVEFFDNFQDINHVNMEWKYDELDFGLEITPKHALVFYWEHDLWLEGHGIGLKHEVDFSNYSEAVNKIKEIITGKEETIKKYKNELSALLDKIKERDKKVKYTEIDAVFKELYHEYISLVDTTIDADAAVDLAFGTREDTTLRDLCGKYGVSPCDIDSLIARLYKEGIIDIKDNKVFIGSDTLESHFASENIEVEKGFIDFANRYIRGVIKDKYNIYSILNRLARGKEDDIKEIIDEIPAPTLALAIQTMVQDSDSWPIPYELMREALPRLPPDDVLEILMKAGRQTLKTHRDLIENNLSKISPLNRYIAKYIYDYHKEIIKDVKVSLASSSSSKDAAFYYFRTDDFIVLVNKIEGGRILFIFASPIYRIGIGYTGATLKEALLKAQITYNYAVHKIRALHLDETGHIIRTAEGPIIVPMYKGRIIIADSLSKIEEEKKKEEEGMSDELEPV